jgi:type VI secretion system secreted protein Hcp
MPIYLKIKDIKGSITKKGRENWIEVLSVEHEVISPRDAASGQATGKRQHRAFVVTKAIDQATPALYSALTKNQVLNDWLLEATAVELTGVEKVTYRVKLGNAFIAGIAFQGPGQTDLDRGKLVESVSFVYEKIEWTWVPTNTTATDQWS